MTRRIHRYPNEISQYRRRQDWTQAQLAQQLGVQRATVVTRECGYVIPRLPRLFELARELNTIVENLYWPLYRPTVPM